MITSRQLVPLVSAVLIGLLTAVPTRGQGPQGHGPMRHDAAHAADMQRFHQLFDHRSEISRQVVKRADGVETVTESTNPEVARLLRTHVASMLARVEDGRPIHRRDPLFAELFRHADRVTARHDATADGVRVVETSDDPYVVLLLQAHADVVSAFIANGRSEMMKNHPVPSRP